MATQSVTQISGFAFCPDPRCAGNKQEPVRLDATRNDYTYTELGGDIAGVERSTVTLRLADESQAGCSTCGTTRSLTDQARPEYDAFSGYAQDGLLHVKRFNASRQAGGNDAVLAEMMREMREQRETIATLMANQQPGEATKVVAPEEEARQQQIREARIAGLAKAREARAANRATEAVRSLSAADTVGVVVKGGPGKLCGWFISNANAATRFVKFYNKATAPATNGSDTPLLTLAIPAGSAANVSFESGIAFTVGIGLRITTGVADNDTGAPAASEVIVNSLIR